jgi:aryl-alcohol dehydrogenase-like predicted oxidoreductase
MVCNNADLFYSVCNFGPVDSKKFAECGALPTSNQLPYNLLWRCIEFDVMPVAQQDNWGILAYSPLQQGLLTGKFTTAEEVPEGRRRTRHFKSSSTVLSRHGGGGCETETFAAIASLQKTCDGAGLLMGEVALAWLLAQPQVVSVIVGASKPSQIAANAKVPALSAALVAECNDVTAEVKQQLGNNPDMWAATSRVK